MSALKKITSHKQNTPSWGGRRENCRSTTLTGKLTSGINLPKIQGVGRLQETGMLTTTVEKGGDVRKVLRGKPSFYKKVAAKKKKTIGNRPPFAKQLSEKTVQGGMGERGAKKKGGGRSGKNVLAGFLLRWGPGIKISRRGSLATNAGRLWAEMSRLHPPNGGQRDWNGTGERGFYRIAVGQKNIGGKVKKDHDPKCYDGSKGRNDEHKNDRGGDSRTNCSEAIRVWSTHHVDRQPTKEEKM